MRSISMIRWWQFSALGSSEAKNSDVTDLAMLLSGVPRSDSEAQQLGTLGAFYSTLLVRVS